VSEGEGNHNEEILGFDLKNMARTTMEVVQEMRAEAASADYLMLAVAFEEDTKFISSHLSDEQALKKLNEMVNAGGTPLGFIKANNKTIDGGKAQVFLETKVLKDHSGEAAASAENLLTQMLQRSSSGIPDKT
jgi:hypothetical protein